MYVCKYFIYTYDYNIPHIYTSIISHRPAAGHACPARRRKDAKKKRVTTRVIPRHLSHLICTSAPALMSSYTTGSRVAAAAWCSGVRPFSASTADVRVAGGCKASGLSPASSSTACPPPSPPLPARAGPPTPLHWQIVPGTLQGTIPEASTPCKALPTRCCAKPPDLHTCLHPHPICNMYAKGGKAEWGREGPNRREGADQCGG